VPDAHVVAGQPAPSKGMNLNVTSKSTPVSFVGDFHSKFDSETIFFPLNFSQRSVWVSPTGDLPMVRGALFDCFIHICGSYSCHHFASLPTTALAVLIILLRYLSMIQYFNVKNLYLHHMP